MKLLKQSALELEKSSEVLLDLMPRATEEQRSSLLLDSQELTHALDQWPARMRAQKTSATKPMDAAIEDNSALGAYMDAGAAFAASEHASAADARLALHAMAPMLPEEAARLAWPRRSLDHSATARIWIEPSEQLMVASRAHVMLYVPQYKHVSQETLAAAVATGAHAGLQDEGGNVLERFGAARIVRPGLWSFQFRVPVADSLVAFWSNERLSPMMSSMPVRVSPLDVPLPVLCAAAGSMAPLAQYYYKPGSPALYRRPELLEDSIARRKAIYKRDAPDGEDEAFSEYKASGKQMRESFKAVDEIHAASVSSDGKWVAFVVGPVAYSASTSRLLAADQVIRVHRVNVFAGADESSGNHPVCIIPHTQLHLPTTHLLLVHDIRFASNFDRKDSPTLLITCSSFNRIGERQRLVFSYNIATLMPALIARPALPVLDIACDGEYILMSHSTSHGRIPLTLLDMRGSRVDVGDLELEDSMGGCLFVLRKGVFCCYPVYGFLCVRAITLQEEASSGKVRMKTRTLFEKNYGAYMGGYQRVAGTAAEDNFIIQRVTDYNAEYTTATKASDGTWSFTSLYKQNEMDAGLAGKGVISSMLDATAPFITTVIKGNVLMYTAGSGGAGGAFGGQKIGARRRSLNKEKGKRNIRSQARKRKASRSRSRSQTRKRKASRSRSRSQTRKSTRTNKKRT